MPVRTRSQRIGDAGQNFVRETVDGHQHWMCRAQDLDYGVDLEAELAPTEEDEQRPSGRLLKLQVKSTENVEMTNGQIAISLDRQFLDYAQQFRLPVLLIVVEPSMRRAWWLWLQEWLLHHEVRLAASPRTSTVTVHIPDTQTLEAGLNGSWQRIAAGQAPAAVVLSLRDLVAIASSDRDHVELLESALQLLDKVEAPNRTWAVEKIVDAMVGLGPNAGLWQMSQYIRPLVIAVDRLGDSFTTEQVVRMVQRGESYSRAGLYGLAQLYDRWPEHTRSLGLPDVFRKGDMQHLEWYCLAREHYPEISSFNLWAAFADGRLPVTRFGDLDIASEGLSIRLYRSWPNRGDSTLLDNLIWVGDPNEADET